VASLPLAGRRHLASHAFSLYCSPFRAWCLHKEISQEVELDCGGIMTLNHEPWLRLIFREPLWIAQKLSIHNSTRIILLYLQITKYLFFVC
jgi:hypothetical protein